MLTLELQGSIDPTLGLTSCETQQRQHAFEVVADLIEYTKGTHALPLTQARKAKFQEQIDALELVLSLAKQVQ